MDTRDDEAAGEGAGPRRREEAPRRARLKAALRANMGRRKAQARERARDEDEEGDG